MWRRYRLSPRGPTALVRMNAQERIQFRKDDGRRFQPILQKARQSPSDPVTQNTGHLPRCQMAMSRASSTICVLAPHDVRIGAVVVKRGAGIAHARPQLLLQPFQSGKARKTRRSASEVLGCPRFVPERREARETSGPPARSNPAPLLTSVSRDRPGFLRVGVRDRVVGGSNPLAPTIQPARCFRLTYAYITPRLCLRPMGRSPWARERPRWSLGLF